MEAGNSSRCKDIPRVRCKGGTLHSGCPGLVVVDGMDLSRRGVAVEPDPFGLGNMRSMGLAWVFRSLVLVLFSCGAHFHGAFFASRQEHLELEACFRRAGMPAKLCFVHSGSECRFASWNGVLGNTKQHGLAVGRINGIRCIQLVLSRPWSGCSEISRISILRRRAAIPHRQTLCYRWGGVRSKRRLLPVLDILGSRDNKKGNPH